jgi:hypothetical protein
MTKLLPAYAALIAAALFAACGGNQSQQGGQSQPAQATSPPGAVTVTMPPHLSMTPEPSPASCAQPGPNMVLVDAHTGVSFTLLPNNVVQSVWGPNVYLLGFDNPFGLFNQWTSPFWILGNTVTKQQWRVYPVVPFIVGVVLQHVHDESTVEFIPNVGSIWNGSSNVSYQKLVHDYLFHIQFTARYSQMARKAELNSLLTGKPLAIPSPDPAESAQECAFVCPSPSPWATGQTPPPTEQQLLAQIEFGSPPDDSDFQNAPGDPNSQDPHLYDFSCKYLLDQPYTVIWRQETRQQQFNTAVTTVKATIAAYAVPTANVGWVAHQYVTWVASPVKPTFAPEPLLSPSPGGNLQLLIFFQKGGGKIPQLGPPATPFACQDLEPLPTPWPSNAPAPVITGQCAAPF